MWLLFEFYLSTDIDNINVNSVLIGYAPADDPQIAVAVVLEYGGGGANAAPILRAVLDAVFGI